jgi:tRNA pseudouridine13 synthase
MVKEPQPLQVTKLEKSIGIEVYLTRTLGIGGIIRQNADDFAVQEVLVDGSKAKIDNARGFTEQMALGSSSAKNLYLLCVLVKRNWDTFQAIRSVAEQLGLFPAMIHISGIKDAKAVTAQHVTVEGISIDDLQKVHVKDVEVRPIGYVRHKLSPYYLLGNNFHIHIKKAHPAKSQIQKRITRTIKELEMIGGIPNFFGHQRFGTTRPITHLVGKAIVQGNFRKAAMLFLAKPSPYEHPASREARHQLQTTEDFKQALQTFPKQLRYERPMLKYLVKNPDNFVGAFKRLPIKLRLLFTQAYQSYLFNMFLSRRIKNGFSLNVAEVGDYVMNVERSGLPMPMMYKKVSSRTLTETRQLLKSGKMRLAIPLIGFKQRPSEGVQGEIERQILEEENVAPENFKTPTMPETSVRGELRAAISPVNNFSLEEISCNTAPSICNVRISFALYRGSYATVFLRELMKPRNPIKAKF